MRSLEIAFTSEDGGWVASKFNVLSSWLEVVRGPGELSVEDFVRPDGFALN